MAKSKATAPCSQSQQHRRTRTVLRYLYIVAALWIGTAVMSETISAQSCDAGPGSDNDPELCDSWSVDDAWKINHPSERGTVGSLLRWSAKPGASELPQPDAPLVTSRPSFTASSSVVGLGVLQIESGYQYTFDDNGSERSVSNTYPNTQLRYGILANWLEFQLAFNFTDQSINGISSTSADDLALGTEIGLTPQDGWRPQMALISQMSIGVDRGAGANRDVLPGLDWIYSWSVTDSISIAGSSQFNRAIDRGTDATYTQWAQSCVGSYSLSDRVSSYGEYYGLYPSNADTDRVEHYFDSGLLYLLSNNVQWDIWGGLGLNDQADDYFFGSGLSVRYR